MRLAVPEARNRLAAHDHGVLATVHPERGVDAVPVVYAVVDDLVGVPVDRVKPKADGPLQRERNLAVDPRAALLVEHWDPVDWSRLWWVRAELHRTDADTDSVERLAASLADRFAQYAERPFARILTFRIARVSGWAAGG